jgi:hypothetical protein
MKRQTSGLRRTLAALVCLALCLGFAIPAGAKSKSPAYDFLAEAKLPQILGSDHFDVDGTSFYRLTVPAYLPEQYAQSSYAAEPGKTDAHVGKLKDFLNTAPAFLPHDTGNEFVTYSQCRPEVLNLFDTHLAVLVQTLYDFCGLKDKKPCVDELTMYLFKRLAKASSPMRNAVEVVYKHRLIQQGLLGTVNRDGKSDNLYYYAQTDPDWAAMSFEYEGNGATIKARGCGCVCASMVISTYHKVEITPRWTREFALDGSWTIDAGLPNTYFPKLCEHYKSLETDRYGTTLKEPKIILKKDLDMDELIDEVANKHYMCIVNVLAGAFTKHEHYIVLEDYKEIDGVGYFLVADPYILPSRYSSWDQLKKTDTGNDGLIYATPKLLLRDARSFIVFEQDRYELPLVCRATGAERIQTAKES